MPAPDGDTTRHGRAQSARRAAFVDRDGVIIEERGYAWHTDDFALLPGAAGALRELQAAGYLLVVVTNQSGIARGLYTEADYERFTTHMRSQLASLGVRLDAVEHCPHLPDGAVDRYRVECDCRKPLPGMLRRATAALDIDVGASVMIGDRISDVAAGRAAGVGHCLLVRSGEPLPAGAEVLADGVYDDLAAAVRALLHAAVRSDSRA